MINNLDIDQIAGAVDDPVLKLATKLIWKYHFRMGDLLDLRKSDFKPYRNGKEASRKGAGTGIRRQLTLDDDLSRYLATLPADCPWVFPDLRADGSWKKETIARFAVHLKRAMHKINGIRLHDLRRLSLEQLARRNGA
jgi:integrase